MPKFCEQCGISIADDKKFCENCGAPVEPFTQPSLQTPLKEPAVTPVPEVTAKKIPNWLFILIGVIVVVAIASALFLIPKTTTDPIIGSWDGGDTQWIVYPNATITWWYKETSPGYNTLIADNKPVVRYLTWTKNGTDRYLATTSNAESAVYVYDATRDIIYREDNPEYFVRRSNVPLSPPAIVRITQTSTVPPTTKVTTKNPEDTDPIIGVWRYKSDKYEWRIKFDADGTLQTAGEKYIHSGTWRAMGNNKYNVSLNISGIVESFGEETWTYDPSSKTIHEDKYKNLLYYPYQGNVAIT